MTRTMPLQGVRGTTSLLVFQPDHMIDIITNSSSELFVLAGSNQEAVTASIAAVYPDYLTEYQEVKSFDQLSNDEISTYLDFSDYLDYDRRTRDPIPDTRFPGIFAAAEVWHKRTWNLNKPNDFSWQLNEDVLFAEHNRQRLKRAIDPEGNKFFLFSQGDNPNWDMQEKLEEIGGERYHLG